MASLAFQPLLGDGQMVIMHINLVFFFTPIRHAPLAGSCRHTPKKKGNSHQVLASHTSDRVCTIL